MAATATSDPKAFEPHMKAPVAVSVLFHVAVVIVAIFGFPFIKREFKPLDNAVTVEIVDMRDGQKEKPPEKELKPQPPEQPKEAPPRPAMPKVTAEKPPSPIAPAPPEKIEEFTPPEQKEKPAPVKKPEPVKAKEPPKKPEPVKTPPQEEAQEDPFKGLLKNLMDAEQPSQEKTEKPEKGAAAPVWSQGEINQLSASINRQLTNCWKVLHGVREAEKQIVDLKFFMNRDGSLRDVRVTDQLRYNTDSAYRAAAEAAIRAAYNPQCNPLDLPMDKYDLWETINARFDPSQML